MPILPVDHPQPLYATIGVMLYPTTDELDPPKARAFAAHRFANLIRHLDEAGFSPSYEDLLRVVLDQGETPDIADRWWGGASIGEVFKVLLILAETEAGLASWNNAIKYVELFAERNKVKGRRANLWEARRRFLSVAHLWGAWSFRERRFVRPEADWYSEFQLFLTQAEDLRVWGQTWQAPRAKSKPLLPADVWRAPDGWKAPKAWPDWPETKFALDPEIVRVLRPAGRPRKHHD
jgi:hypothetical protein